MSDKILLKKMKKDFDHFAAERSNKFCFICRKKGLQTDVVFNFGIFVCTECGSIHRSLNNRVQNPSYINLSKTQFDKVIKNGNRRAQKLWLHNWKEDSIKKYDIKSNDDKKRRSEREKLIKDIFKKELYKATPKQLKKRKKHGTLRKHSSGSSRRIKAPISEKRKKKNGTLRVRKKAPATVSGRGNSVPDFFGHEETNTTTNNTFNEESFNNDNTFNEDSFNNDNTFGNESFNNENTFNNDVQNDNGVNSLSKQLSQMDVKEQKQENVLLNHEKQDNVGDEITSKMENYIRKLMKQYELDFQGIAPYLKKAVEKSQHPIKTAKQFEETRFDPDFQESTFNPDFEQNGTSTVENITRNSFANVVVQNEEEETKPSFSLDNASIPNPFVEDMEGGSPNPFATDEPVEEVKPVTTGVLDMMPSIEEISNLQKEYKKPEENIMNNNINVKPQENPMNNNMMNSMNMQNMQNMQNMNMQNGQGNQQYMMKMMNMMKMMSMMNNGGQNNNMMNNNMMNNNMMNNNMMQQNMMNQNNMNQNMMNNNSMNTNMMNANVGNNPNNEVEKPKEKDTFHDLTSLIEM